MIVPSAQVNAAIKMMTTPVTETRPEPPPRPDRKPTPTRPRTKPASGARPSRAWFSAASMPSSHSGTVATSSAASPEGSRCSPMPTAPLAHSSRMPAVAQPIHSARLGQRCTAWPARTALRRAPMAAGNMMAPATRFRAAAISSGGMVSTPTLMAR